MSISKSFKGFLSIILCIVLVVGFTPLPTQRALADELQVATSEQIGAQATVTVKIVNNLSLKKGLTKTLAIDSITDNDKVWYSSDTSVATVRTVNGKGEVTGKKAGTCIVYVHCRTIDARYGVRLTVTGPKKVAISKKKLTVKVGKTAKLKLKNATASKVKWTSKNKKVATVSKKGVVKGKKAGKVTIVAKYKGKTYKCKVTVKKVKKIALSKKKLTVRVGKTAKLKLKNATASKVKWTSKNKKVATVSKKGVVKGKKAGKVTIVAKYKGKKYTCKVTVKKKLVKVKQTKNGSKIVKLKKGKKAVVGTLKKDGYQVIIPAGALKAGTKVKVTVKNGMIDLTALGKKNVRLNKMATVKIALTSTVPIADADNWWGTYTFGGETHLIKPSIKQLRRGVLSYQVSYFTQSGGKLSTSGSTKLSALGAGELQAQDIASWFGAKKLTDKQKRVAVAYRDALNDISKDAQNDAVQSFLEKCFGDAAESLGFKAGTTGYDKVMKQLGKSSDLMALVRAAKSGDESTFTGKATEMLTKVIVENADGTKVGYLGSAVGSIPGVLQDVKKGDYAGASKRVAKAVTSNIPYVKYVQFTAAVTEATIDYYVDEETEAGYQAYYAQLQSGEYGYNAWNNVAVKQMAAPLREMERRALQAYADAHGVSVKSLSAAEQEKVRATVKDTLIRQWNYRAAHQAQIEARQNETLELLKWFDEVGLMNRGDMSVDFSDYDDYQQRLENLLHVRDAIVDIMGGKTFSEITGRGENWLGSKQAVKDYNNENMAKLVLMWVKNGWGTGKNPAKGRLAVAKYLAENYGVGVSVSPKTLSLQVGDESALKMKGTYGKVSWTSSDDKVAKVSNKGVVTAVKKGTATIYANYGKKSFECKVTVKKKQPRTVYVSGSQTVEFETGGSNGIIICRVGAGYNDSYDDGWYFGVNETGTQKVSVLFDHPTKGYTKYVFTLVGKAETPDPGSAVVYAIGAVRFNLDTEAWD